MNTAQIRVAALLWNGLSGEIERLEDQREDIVRDLNILATKYARRLSHSHFEDIGMIQRTTESAELSAINPDGSFEFTIVDGYTGDQGPSFNVTAEQLIS